MRRLVWVAPPVAVTLLTVRAARRAYRRLVAQADEATAYAVAELSGPWA